MIIKLVLFLASALIVLEYLSLLAKEIVQFLRIKSDDIDVNATVINLVPHLTGDVQPILQYNIDGSTKAYIYHYYCSPERYSIGDEVTIKLSRKSGFVYVKEDLLKGLLLRLAATIMLMVALLYLVFELFM
ncbi:MAG: hypothetical protein NC124_20495 [Clostridium sp.]|nr:hypothetical protein [Clostridium sp.]